MTAVIVLPQEITVDETPLSERWNLSPLFKVSETGALIRWQVGFDGQSHLEMRFGHVKGVMRTTRTEVKKNKSKRSIQEQALLEARQRYNLKIKEGYDRIGEEGTALPHPMSSATYSEGSIQEWPVMTQPKLNGIRMLVIRNSDEKLILFSRRGNCYNHLTHLEKDIATLMSALPAEAMLDGELYNHHMDFTEMASAIRTVKTTHTRLSEIQYWIFDVSLPLPFEQRFQLLEKAFAAVSVTSLLLVKTRLASSHQEIVEQHQEHIQDGYEGIMIRKIAGDATSGPRYQQSLYRQSRCSNIMKYKLFIDEEALIIDVLEAEGTEKGTSLFQVRDIRNNVFVVRMRGDFGMRRYWLLHPEEVIRKKVTFRYQELSIYGVPRFPVGIAIRDYE